jgi:hypothetical protein
MAFKIQELHYRELQCKTTRFLNFCFSSVSLMAGTSGQQNRYLLHPEAWFGGDENNDLLIGSTSQAKLDIEVCF